MPTDGDDGNRKEKHGWIRPANFIVGIFTLIALGVYTLYTREQVEQSKRANMIAQAALVEANRPYVVWSGFHITRIINPVTKIGDWRIGTEAQNVGNTPASNVIYYPCDPIILEGEASPNIECKRSEATQGGSVIGPRQTSSAIGAPIKDDVILAVQAATKSLYIAGYFIYEDSEQFSGSVYPKRLTKYCNLVLVSNDNTPFEIGTGRRLNVTPFGCGIADWSCTDAGCKTIPPEGQQ